MEFQKSDNLSVHLKTCDIKPTNNLQFNNDIYSENNSTNRY